MLKKIIFFSSHLLCITIYATIDDTDVRQAQQYMALLNANITNPAIAQGQPFLTDAYSLLYKTSEELLNIRKNIQKGTTNVLNTEVDELASKIEQLLPKQQQTVFSRFLISTPDGYSERELKKQQKNWSTLEKNVAQLREELKKAVLEEQQATQLLQAAEQKKQEERKEKVKKGAVFFQNIIILLDVTESSGQLAQAVTTQFAIALCQKSAPIIIHKHTLGLFAELHKKQTEGIVMPEWADLPTWLDKNWLVYQSKGQKEAGRMLLLVPQNITNEYVDGLHIQGHMPLNWKELLNSNLVSWFQTDTIKAHEVTYWFAPNKDVLWNIYMTGHGTITGGTGSKIPDFFAHRRFNEPFDIYQHQVTISGLDVPEFRKFVVEISQRTINILLYVSCFSGGYSLYLPYINNLISNSKVFSSLKISGPLGAITPARKQESSAALMKSDTTIEEWKPNFTIVVSSATDTPVLLSGNQIVEACSKQPRFNFTAFFNSLITYAEKYIKTRKTNELQAAHYSDTELRESLRRVEPFFPGTEKDFLNMPQVMFPSAERFIYFPLYPDKVTVITHSKAMAARLEGKNIEIPSTKTTVPAFIALAAETIDATVQIHVASEKEMPKILSLLPGIGVCTITGINAPAIGLTTFLRSFIFSEIFGFPKYYFLKELLLKEDADIEWADTKDGRHIFYNVLIGFRGADAQRGSRAAGVAALCTSNDGRLFLIRQTDTGRMFSLQPIEAKISLQSTENIIAQQLAIFDNKDLYNAPWWQEQGFLLNAKGTEQLFEPLRSMLKFMQKNR